MTIAWNALSLRLRSVEGRYFSVKEFISPRGSTSTLVQLGSEDFSECWQNQIGGLSGGQAEVVQYLPFKCTPMVLSSSFKIFAEIARELEESYLLSCHIDLGPSY